MSRALKEQQGNQRKSLAGRTSETKGYLRTAPPRSCFSSWGKHSALKSGCFIRHVYVSCHFFKGSTLKAKILGASQWSSFSFEGCSVTSMMFLYTFLPFISVEELKDLPSGPTYARRCICTMYAKAAPLLVSPTTGKYTGQCGRPELKG